MTGETIKEFLVGLGWDIDEAGMKKFDASITETGKKLAVLAAAVTATAGAILAGITKVAIASEKLGYLSEWVKSSVANLEMLGYVSEQLGVSADQSRAAIEGFAKFMRSTPMGESFLRSFGVATRDANGELKDTTELLFSVGQRIKDMPRYRQMVILGRLGIDENMLRVITKDVGDLQTAFRKMYEVAGVDAEDAAKSSREFMNELRTLKTLAEMLARAVSLSFIKKIKEDLITLRKAVMDNFDRIAEIMKFVIGIVLRVAGAIGAMVVRSVKWVASLIDWFRGLHKLDQIILGGILALAAAWKFLNLAFLATPLGKLIALAVVIALLIDDFQTWKEGGKSLIDWNSNWAKSLAGLVFSLGLLVTGMAAAKAAMVVYTFAVNAAKVATVAFNLVTNANPWVRAAMFLLFLAGMTIAYWGSVKTFFQGFYDWLAGIFGGIGGQINWAINGILKIIGLAEKAKEQADKAWNPENMEVDPLTGEPIPAPAQGEPRGFDLARAANNSAQVSGQRGWGGVPLLLPSVTNNQGGNSLSANTTINVQGGKDSAATGRAVAGEQNRVNANLTRNLLGATY